MITCTNILIVIILSLIINASDTRTIVEVCPGLPESTLTTILGSAYNPRYMSIEEPHIMIEPLLGTKRSSPEEDFAVDDNYHHELSEKPAWEINHITEVEHFARQKRNAENSRTKAVVNDDTDDTSLSSNSKESNNNKRDYRHTFLQSIQPSKGKIFQSRPWECDAQIRWIDLGYEYFPRYLRTVECTKKQCWYGHYICKPRSFTVKVLRRKLGECTRISEKLVMASKNKITGEFTELWIWEEKAVNFCCDCVMK